MAEQLPRKLYLVTWWAALGWPEPQRRRITARKYKTAKDAGAQLARIEALPTHCELISVHVTDCTWEPVDPATLPRPALEDDEVDDGD